MIGDMAYPEGATPLDPNELGGLKHKHITTRGELDELEQVNIASGLRWLTRQRGDVLTGSFATSICSRYSTTVSPPETGFLLFGRLY